MKNKIRINIQDELTSNYSKETKTEAQWNKIIEGPSPWEKTYLIFSTSRS